MAAVIVAKELIELKIIATRSDKWPSFEQISILQSQRTEVNVRAILTRVEVACFKILEQIRRQCAGGEVKVKGSLPDRVVV